MATHHGALVGAQTYGLPIVGPTPRDSSTHPGQGEGTREVWDPPPLHPPPFGSLVVDATKRPHQRAWRLSPPGWDHIVRGPGLPRDDTSG
jgi:hypothetical protein